MSYHAEDYKAAGAKVLAYLNTKPGLVVVGFLVGMIVGRLAHG